jgi:hypothetical protein
VALADPSWRLFRGSVVRAIPWWRLCRGSVVRAIPSGWQFRGAGRSVVAAVPWWRFLFWVNQDFENLLRILDP